MLLLGVEPDTRTPTEARAATTEARSMLIVVRQKIPVEKFIVFSALCFCFSCCLLLL